MTRHDLVIRNARVLDPGSGRDGSFDIALRAGRVSAVEPQLETVDGAEELDASGLLVTPGLIDLHTHVFRGVSYWGLDPDAIAWRTGVTTWVDAGSAGGYSVDGFRELVVQPARVRVLALLNISALGMIAESHELHVLDHLDVDVVCRAAADNPDLVRGVKVRLDRRTVGAHGLIPLERALAAGDRSGLPVMVHIGYAPPTVPDILALLRPGDIVTHCASGLADGIVDADGEVSAAMRAAHERGVVLDLGHGVGGFAFDVAACLLAARVGPDVISSDLHSRSVHGPAFDLPFVMTKMLALGMTLPEVIAATTVRPARALALAEGIGTLAVGAPADLALWRVEDGDFPLVDVHGQVRAGAQRLVNVATYVGGVRLAARGPQAAPWWVPLSDAQQAHSARVSDGLRTSASGSLGSPDDFDQPFDRPATQHETPT